MRKYLYTTLLLALLAQEGVMAQENEGKKGGFFGKIKDTFSTFKDIAVFENRFSFSVRFSPFHFSCIDTAILKSIVANLYFSGECIFNFYE